MTPDAKTSAKPVHAANRLGLDFADEATRMPRLDYGIVDVHSHINGREAANLYRKVAEQYGVRMTYSMTQLEDCEAIREIMEGRIRFIAVPDYWNEEDRLHSMGAGFYERIERYHALGSNIVKFWAAPRGRDFAEQMGDPELMSLDHPTKLEAMRIASDLGMVFMTHIADPNTWFEAKYTDASRYGTKCDQYVKLERLLDEFTQPWIAAHLGGWPEDLEFLTGLLDRHDNLHLDTSATKWMVRELSKHSRDELLDFLRRFRGRVMFGSDIVSSDEHLSTNASAMDTSKQATTRDEAYDLYASRYWALRTLWETSYDGPSPIADPDLAMVDPDAFDEMDAPNLIGKRLPEDVLKSLYSEAAEELLGGAG